MEKAPARAAAARAAALAQCPEAACRCYLPRGRRQGRYWVAGDLHGARGRSLYALMCSPGPPPPSTTDDLLDLIRHRIGAGTLRPALDDARAFLALPQDLGTAVGRTFAVGCTIHRLRDGWNGGGRAMRLTVASALNRISSSLSPSSAGSYELERLMKKMSKPHATRRRSDAEGKV